MAQATDLKEAQLTAAEASGDELLNSAMRASAVSYDRPTARVVVNLVNGCIHAFPAQLVEDLNGAGDDELAQVEVDGVGFNLHWPRLDVDLYFPDLISGIFGTRAWMTRELARHAGQVKSPANAAAARVNGGRGGRPRKSASG